MDRALVLKLYRCSFATTVGLWAYLWISKPLPK